MTMITPSYLGETIEYSSLHACRSTLEDPTMVAAVEALEGTDVALRRAAGLVGAGLVIAKAAKPGQDMRFDRPAIGPATVELLAEIGAAMIGVEAGIALILESDRTLDLARAKNVILYGYAETSG